MEGVKSFFASKTIWGAIVSLASIAPSIATLFGYSVSAEDAAGAVSAVQAIGASVGALLSIYGRVAASKKIG